MTSIVVLVLRETGSSSQIFVVGYRKLLLDLF